MPLYQIQISLPATSLPFLKYRGKEERPEVLQNKARKMWQISFSDKIVGIGTNDATSVYIINRMISKHTKQLLRFKNKIFLCISFEGTGHKLYYARFFSTVVDNVLSATPDRCVSELPNMCRAEPQAGMECMTMQ